MDESVDPVEAHQVMSFTLTATNSGPASASEVQIRHLVGDKVSARGVTYGSQIDWVTPSQGVCDWDKNLATCDLGTLANGATATVTVQVLVLVNNFVVTQPTGAMVNTAVVSSASTDSNPANNIDAEATVITAA